MFVGSTVNDAIKPQRKDKPPVRPSSAVRKSTNSSNNNTPPTGKSAPIAETPKRADRRVPAKKVIFPPITCPDKSILYMISNVFVQASTPRATTPQANDSLKMVQSMIELKTPSAAETIEIVNIDISESSDVAPVILTPETVATESVKAPVVEAVAVEASPTADDAAVKVEITTTEEIQSVPHENVGNSMAEGKQNLVDPFENADMTASMIQRRINTEEEAKAALAERRRLAREEAERQAELERQRLEAEREAELKRQAEEEERQRRLEEETLRLVEEQRRAEEQRLQQAIEEAKQREAEEKRRKEEEERQKTEREEQERKARDEAEKQKAEVAERLKKEEKEREERRKRVEAIMLRTRKNGVYKMQN